MRVARVLFVSVLSVAGLAALPAAPPAQETVPETCPRPGYVIAPGPGATADRNGNGVVCVNPTTGAVSDDVDPPTEQHKDANHNGIVCYNPDKGVVTDDHLSQNFEEGSSCPPGFVHYPAVLFL